MRVAFDVDGVITDYRRFLIENGSHFFRKKIENGFQINEKGADLYEIFDCSKREYTLFWAKYLFKYATDAPLKEGINRTIQKIQEEGHQVLLFTSRKYTDEESIKGKFFRKCVKKYLKKYNIYPDHIEFLKENDDKTEMCKRYDISVIVEDNPTNIAHLSKERKVIRVDEPYNQNSVLENVEVAKHSLDIYQKVHDIALQQKSACKQQNFTIPKMTTFAQLEHELDQFPNDIFLDYFNRTMTKREVKSKIYKCIGSMYERNIKPGDVVTICMPNAPEAIIAFYAALAIGSVPQMLHPLSSKNEIEKHIVDTQAKMMILYDECYCKIEDFIENTSVESIITVSAKDSMPVPLKLGFSANEFYQKMLSKGSIHLEPFYQKMNHFINETFIENKRQSLLENYGDLGFTPYEKFPYSQRFSYLFNTYSFNLYNNIDSKVHDKFNYYHRFLKKKRNTPQNNSKYMTWHAFEKLSELYTKKIELSNCVDEKVAVLLYTGGTTGVQKAVQLAQRSFTSMPLQFAESAKAVGLEFKRGDCILAIPPIFHGFGIGSSVHTAWCNGVAIKLVIKYDHDNFHKQFEGTKITHITLVPTMLDKIISNPKIKKAHLQNVQGIVVGGDILKEDTIQRWERYTNQMGLNIPLYVGYGLSETLAGFTLTDQNVKEGNVGKPMIGNEIKIMDKTAGIEVAKGNVGTLFLKGPTVMLGYDAEEDASLITDQNGDTWLDTGDLGYIDADGNIQFVDREKRMFLCNGYNIYPSTIEKIISMHPSIASCIAVAKNHPYKTSVPSIFMTLKETYSDSLLLREEILALCKQNLPEYSIPDIRDLHFVDEIETTIYGKPNYLKLQKSQSNKIYQKRIGG